MVRRLTPNSAANVDAEITAGRTLRKRWLMACNRSARFIGPIMTDRTLFRKLRQSVVARTPHDDAMSTSESPELAWVVIYVSSVADALAFYTKAFGLAVAFQHPGGDYAEFATGTTALALCKRALAAESTGLMIGTGGPPRSNITLVVPDVPAAFDRAVTAGAAEVAKPVTKPWGQVSSYVADPDGNLIEIATRVEN